MRQNVFIRGTTNGQYHTAAGLQVNRYVVSEGLDALGKRPLLPHGARYARADGAVARPAVD